MLFTAIPPQKKLQDHIAYFWLAKSTPLETGRSYCFIPDGYVDWIFHLKAPWTFRYKQDQLFTKAKTHVFGHAKRNIEIRLPAEKVFAFGIKFQPWAAGNVWGSSMNETTDMALSGADFESFLFHRIKDLLLDETDPLKIIPKIEVLFLKHLVPQKQTDLKDLIKRLASGKLLDAKEINISKRRLEQRFQKEIGISQKLYLRTIRINKVINHIRANENIKLTQVAYQFGYFDQSHFIRDFKSFTGQSPRQFLGSINPNGALLNFSPQKI